MEQVAVTDLVYESNRKYGTDRGFEQLKESIGEYGILEPILVRPLGDGRYRVIAGRRRAQAAAEAGLTAVDCIVREDDTDDEELALVENVNRLEMHPLEEADIFRRMKDAGATVEYIARYFARSRTAISQRLRLSGLAAGAREMFREGRLDIQGAVLLSGLAEDDQEAFCKKYEGKEAAVWQAQDYIVRTQRCLLYPFLLADGCESCEERTRNGDGSLFEEDYRFDDVCLNPDCYKEQWHRLLRWALRETERGDPGGREIRRIAFDMSIPKHLYEHTGEVEFDGKRYEVLNPQRYILDSGETKRKKNVYWRVARDRGSIRVTRCGYETREAQKKSAAKQTARQLAAGYGKELLGALGAEWQEAPEAIAGDLKSRGMNQYDFRACMEKRIRRRVEERNLAHPGSRNYAGMYLRHAWGASEEGLEKYTGFKSFEDIPLEGKVQGLFHFLISLVRSFEFRPPTFDSLAAADPAYRETLFWEYAGMDEAGYRALYLEEARKVVEHLRQGGTAKALEEEAEHEGSN
jgi:ParB/RepB/Spo0J family partition protein